MATCTSLTDLSFARYSQQNEQKDVNDGSAKHELPDRNGKFPHPPLLEGMPANLGPGSRSSLPIKQRAAGHCGSSTEALWSLPNGKGITFILGRHRLGCWLASGTCRPRINGEGTFVDLRN
jgi:hypothetical protein